MLGYKEKVTGIASHSNRQRLGRGEPVVPPCVWRDVHRMIAECHETLVDWPQDTLWRFMLEEVLLHELGHHVLQHHKGKRPERIARTRDHEAFAARFAEKQRAALLKGRSH